MCIPVAVAIGVTVATTAASIAMASQQANAQAKAGQKAADQANDAALKQTSAEYRQQEATMRWQDDNWQSDLDFATQTLSYQGQEFAKQGVYVSETAEAIKKNQNEQFAQAALKAVQQNISTTLSEANVASKGAADRATEQAKADARGAEGNSVNAIIDDVHRQQGQALSVMEQNRSAMAFQARTDMESLKAAGDTQLGQLVASIKTYSPSTPIRSPQPVGGVQSPTLVSPPPAPSQGAAIISGVSQGLQAGLSTFQGINSLTGQTTGQSLGSLGTFLGIK